MEKKHLFLKIIWLVGFMTIILPVKVVNANEIKQGMNTGIGGFSKILDVYYINLQENNTSIAFNYLKSQEVSGSIITEFACHFVGNPYVWGGTSLEKGADCSGFVKSVYAHFDICLERVSRKQAMKSGYEVETSLKCLKKGDLLFYAKGETVNHVAIYIGNGKIVHAAGEKYGIIISDYDYRTVYKARRVIPE